MDFAVLKAVIQRTTIITIQKRHIAVSTANIAAYSKHSAVVLGVWSAYGKCSGVQYSPGVSVRWVQKGLQERCRSEWGTYIASAPVDTLHFGKVTLQGVSQEVSIVLGSAILF